METTARCAVTERHVARLVHRDTAHPAITGIGRIRALLENGWRSAGRAQFVPTNADAGASSYAVVNDQRLVIAEVAIGESVHQTI